MHALKAQARKQVQIKCFSASLAITATEESHILDKNPVQAENTTRRDNQYQLLRVKHALRVTTVPLEHTEC